MSKGGLTVDSIAVQEIGEPREADILFASIRRKLGRIAVGDDQMPEECFMSEHGLKPVHPPVLSASWQSSELIEDTDIPRTIVRELNDPHVVGEWAIHHVSEPLSDGSPTIDHFDVNGARITVERHAVNKELSGYYEGIMESGIVYDSSLSVADMDRLIALDGALPTPPV